MDSRDAAPFGWLRAVVRRLLGGHRADVILGDMEESYRRLTVRQGRGAADRWYRRDLARTVASVLVDRLRRGLAGARRTPGAVLRALTIDARFAARALRHRPALPLAIVLLVGLGTGGAAAILSLVDHGLLRPLPYSDPDRLVAVWARTTAGGDTDLRLPAPAAALLRDQAKGLESVAFVSRPRNVAMDAGGEPVSIAVAGTTAEIFHLLRPRVILGRVPGARRGASGFGPENPTTLVLSERLWRGAFGADPTVVGRTVRVDGLAHEILAVVALEVPAPAAAGFPDAIDAVRPLPAPLEQIRRGDGRLLDQDSDNTGLVLARLRVGVTPAAAEDELARLATRLRGSEPEYAAAELRLVPGLLAADLIEPVRPLALALLAGAVVLLGVTATNASSLLLVRLTRRRPELAVRAALGATTARLSRQILVEIALLVAGGGALAIAVAAIVLPVMRRAAPGTLRSLHAATLSAPAILGSIALLAVALAALALAARPAGGPGGAVGTRSGGRGTGAPRVRAWLVGAQVAFAFLFLVSTGLLGRTVAALQHVEPGFATDGVLTFELSLRSPARWRGPAERARFVFDLTREIETLPGAEAAGVTAELPLTGASWSRPWGRPGQAPELWSENEAEFRAVTSRYFAAVGTSLVAGRGFLDDEDLHEERRVAIIDESLATLLAPNGDALGMSIGVPVDGAAVEAMVVGIVEPVRHRDLRRPGSPTVYVPFRQEASRDIAFAVRTSADLAATTEGVRRIVAGLAPGLALHDVRPLRRLVEEDMAPSLFARSLAACFTVLAAGSALVGLYALMSFAVATRRREIGLRKAVGADREAILRLVLGDGLRRTGAGLAGGGLLALLAAPRLGGLLYGVTFADPMVWGLSAVTVVGTCIAATAIPALRAASVSAATALREQDRGGR